jgi:hypothetical protein
LVGVYAQAEKLSRFQQIIRILNLLQYTTEEPVSDLPGEVQKNGLLNKLSLELQRKTPQKTY